MKTVAAEVACRKEVSTGLSEWVLDPDAVNRPAVLQVLAEQAPASGRAGRTNDERIPERQRVQAAEIDGSENQLRPDDDDVHSIEPLTSPPWPRSRSRAPETPACRLPAPYSTVETRLSRDGLSPSHRRWQYSDFLVSRVRPITSRVDAGPPPPRRTAEARSRRPRRFSVQARTCARNRRGR